VQKHRKRLISECGTGRVCRDRGRTRVWAGRLSPPTSWYPAGVARPIVGDPESGCLGSLGDPPPASSTWVCAQADCADCTARGGTSPFPELASRRGDGRAHVLLISAQPDLTQPLRTAYARARLMYSIIYYLHSCSPSLLSDQEQDCRSPFTQYFFYPCFESMASRRARFSVHATIADTSGPMASSRRFSR
jgi:hypothetical protein